MNRTIPAALAAVTATLTFAPAASATATIDIACVDSVVKVRFDYRQFASGPPASSHTSVRVDGGTRFDQVVTFDGPSHHEEMNYADLGDGRPHVIEARHQWIDRPTRPVERTVTVTCGTPPAPAPAPVEQPAPQPVAPPAPVLVPAAVTPLAARHADHRAREHQRRVRERRRHGSVRHRTTRHHPPKSTG